VTAAELYRYQNEAGITVVDWAIPAAYVGSGYEVLNESGQIVRVVPPAKTDAELERDAVAARAQEAEAAAQAAQLERDTFLLRRYSTIEDIEAARDRSLRELDIRIAILSGQRDTLSQQLARHQSALDTTEQSDAASPQYEEETVAALRAEIQSLDEASEGRQQQAAALAEAYSRDIARFAELEEIVALRRQMSVTPPSP
jgi:chromosome segregation ATPase